MTSHLFYWVVSARSYGYEENTSAATLHMKRVGMHQCIKMQLNRLDTQDSGHLAIGCRTNNPIEKVRGHVL